MSNNNNPTIPFIIGDGIGPDIWAASQKVFDQAVQLAYKGERKINWLETLAGQKAFESTGKYLPQESIDTLRKYKISIKGPLTTPIGGGFTSLNVTIRKTMDLYSCIRPVKWFSGLPSPLADPSSVDAIIFRENTEDIYAGIEFPANSTSNAQLINFLKENFPDQLKKFAFIENVGVDIKPISKNATFRIMSAAIEWALNNGRKKITIVHKGNIMKYTEGAFRNWAYEIARTTYKDNCFTYPEWKEIKENDGTKQAEKARLEANKAGKIYIDEAITDVVFAKAILSPEKFDILVTTNLNGDYLSDAFAALTGGVGISPGANINFENGTGVFEANHGSAQDIANQDKANPSSIILSGAMMFDFMGWQEAGDLIRKGIEETIRSRNVTYDLFQSSLDFNLVGTSSFGELVINNMEK